METVKYPKIVEDFTEKFIESLTKLKFFEEAQITDLAPARKILSEWLLSHFINGTLIENEPIPCAEDEMNKILHSIVLESALNTLKNLGLLESYYDETMDDEVMWLTDKGKEVGKRLKSME